MQRIGMLALAVAAAAVLFPAGSARSVAASPGPPKGRIAVVVDGGLNLVDVRTGVRREIAAGAMSPASWSHDGRELAYLAGDDFGGTASLRAISVASRRKRVISRLGSGLTVGPSWSSRGEQLAFTLLSGRVVVVDGNGRHRHVVARNASPFELPQWSPDGRRIAYLSDAGRLPAIWVVGANGRGRHIVQRGLLDVPDGVSWSPDGKELAFMSPVGAGADSAGLAIGSVDGKRRRTLATVSVGSGQTAAGDVSWSPRGDSIAFIRWTLDEYGVNRTQSEVWITDRRSGRARVVARAPYIDELAWSPDGRRLAYLTQDPGASGLPRRLWLVRADGSGNRKLACFRQDAAGLAWSPAPHARSSSANTARPSIWRGTASRRRPGRRTARVPGRSSRRIAGR